MGEAYNIFISWSGSRSKYAAEAFRDWLPLILQAAKPWMSSSDVAKGTRGLTEVSNVLQGIKIGMVCLTPENLNAPWILYEAGALSKTIDEKTRLCTYLLGGLKFQDVEPPLGMFQATNPVKDDTLALLRTINTALGPDPIPESNLARLFERMWPDLEQKLAIMPSSGQIAAPKRSVEDMVTELLELARADVNTAKSMREDFARLKQLVTMNALNRWWRVRAATMKQEEAAASATKNELLAAALRSSLEAADAQGPPPPSPENDDENT